MSAPKSDEQVLQQTEAIWRFLDTMSLNKPKEYEQFVDKILKDGEVNNLGPPVAVFVVETVKTPEVIPVRKYYINFAKWVQLPQPENDASPIAMATSDVRKEIIEKEWSHIIDVTLNPAVFPSNDSSRQLEKCALVELVFRHIESKFSIQLSRKFKLLDEPTYMGNKDNLLNFMCPSALKTKLGEAVNGGDKNITLENIKNLSVKDIGGKDNTTLKTKIDCSTKIQGTDNNSMNAEIMTQCHDDTNSLKEVRTVSLDSDVTTNNNNNKCTSLPTPNVEMIVCKDKKSVELTIYLPLVELVSECDLDITETSLSLYVPKKYELELTFPISVNIDDSTAKFVKDQRILLITAACT